MSTLLILAKWALLILNVLLENFEVPDTVMILQIVINLQAWRCYILLRRDSQGNGVVLTVSEMIFILLFNSISILLVCALFIHTGV